MAKKNGGLFGGLFDFNGDGKTDLGERFIAYKIFEECTKEENNDSDDDFTATYHSAPMKTPVSTSPKADTNTASVPNTLTKENYPSRKSELKSSIVISIIVGILISFVPLAVIWATISAYDEKNSVYWLFALLFIGGGFALLAIIWRTAVNEIKSNYNNLVILKEGYRKMLSDEELSAIDKMKRKHRIIAFSILGVLLTGIITVSAVGSVKLSNTYDNAVSAAFDGSYEEAKVILEEFDKDYRDTASLIALCESHISYDKGYVSSAYHGMNEVRFYHLTAEQSKKVNEYKKTLKADYNEYLKKKAESDAKAYRDRITYGVPYVGMPESEIKNTSLGAPSSNVRHNSEMIKGKRYSANLYDFKSGNKTIFTARCVRGKVTQVWDYRNDPIVPYKPKKSTNKPKESTPKKDYSDPYDVNDYSNEEDFYYDHYDDFFDYYDAEKYYKEHHK